MAVFAVTYVYTDDDAGRDQHRPVHREFVGRLGDQGVNLCSGPFGSEEAPGALLLIKAETKQEALDRLQDDPFQINGLVAEVRAQEWIPVSGPLAKDF